MIRRVVNKMLLAFLVIVSIDYLATLISRLIERYRYIKAGMGVIATGYYVAGFAGRSG